MTELRFQFEVFEGPLDLLLHLVRKEEVDIYEVDMVRIADQFCEYVEVMKHFDLHIAGEFIVMASTLMYIKSKELLPVDQQVVVDDEDDEDDPRWDLIRQLVEYRKFKDAGDDLKRMEWEQEQSFLRQGAKPKVPPLPPQKGAPASIFDLVGAINDILNRFEETGKRRAENTREITADKWTVSQKIVKIRELIAEKESILFSELFEETESRQELVATFLALLELVKLKVVLCIQGERFGEIELAKRTFNDDLPADNAPESVGFSALQAGSLDSESMISKTAGLGVSIGTEDEVLTMNVGELAHKDGEPMSFEIADEDFVDEDFEDPNLRELPLSSDVPNSIKNHPPPWTSELNLNYPTKDKVITITLLTVVIILMVLMVL